jgi:hypothetical protein
MHAVYGMTDLIISFRVHWPYVIGKKWLLASGTGAGFLRVLRFPLPIIQPISSLSQSPGADTIGH